MRSKVTRKLKKQKQNQQPVRQVAFKVENVYWHDSENKVLSKDGSVFMLYWQEQKPHRNLAFGEWHCYGILTRDELKYKLGQKQFRKFLCQGTRIFILPVKGEIES